ncbi:MAG TPA: GGDEF domain-containing protein [Miltoncostaeaceae bacterium]|nr:GGDEF domain-containing protein [Miltoncostaeaceae bacterium]
MLVVSDGALRRMRVPRALRRAGLDAPYGCDPLRVDEELRRGGWDLLVWAGGRAELGREAVAMPGTPPIVLVIDATRGADAVPDALAGGFADVVRGDAPAELVARARAVLARDAGRRDAEAAAAGLRELTDGSRDLLARIAPDGTVLFASGAARQILGREPGRLPGTSVLDLCHVAEREALAAALRDERGGVVLHRMRRLHGGWVWMETTVSPVLDPSGRLVEARIDARDVTERRHAEAERAGLARVTAAVAAGAGLAEVAELTAREAAAALGVETAGVARLHGDEAVVIAAAGPGMRAGDRLPLGPPRPGRAVAPVRVDGGVWGMVVAVGADGDGAERLAPHADLVGLAVSNARAHERLVALARTDALTGLANHRAFRERLESDSARARRTGFPVSLVIIDLDNFKRVNDTWGHQAGDAVLREVARRLQASARSGDLPARIGGEELAWLLPDSGVAAARDAAERLRRAIRDIPIPPVGTVTASLGVAELGPGGPDDLVRRADAALYRAKEAGRDACVVAEGPEVTASPSG